MTTSAPAASTPSTWRELYRAVPSLFMSGLVRLRSGSVLAWCLLAAWVSAITMDAVSTVVMQDAGFEEANGPVAVAMAAVGVGPAVFLASLWCLMLASVSLGRPRGTYQWVLVVGLLLILGLKLAVAVSNLTLFWWGVDFI